MRRTLIMILLSAVAAACVNSASHAEQLAVMISPDNAARSELLNVVRAALKQPTLVLADDAFTDTGVLIIERVRITTLSGQLLNGRELAMTQRFQLLIDGGQCLLLHDNTQRRWLLRQVNCITVESAKRLKI